MVTDDGSVFTGDLVVGADGIHSRIRSEMWRLAEDIQPGMITSQEKQSTDDFFAPNQSILRHPAA